MLEKTAVFFDVDDTLLDNYHAFKWTIETYFSELQITESSLKKLYRDFRSNSEKIYHQYQTNQVTSSQQYERWSFVLNALNQKDPLILAELDEAYHRCQSQQRLSAEMMELLDLLGKNEIFCGILTNGFKQQQQRKLDQLGLNRYIEPRWQLISEDLGDAKPNVSCFQKVAAQLPKEITQIYYLGDSYQNDIIPAHLAGWHPIWLNRFADSGDLAVPQAKTSKDAVTLVLSQVLGTGESFLVKN